MGLEFINVHTGEHRNVSDLNAALSLVKARDWAIADPEMGTGSPAWEILLSSAPMMGTYPRMAYDTGAFTPDNTNFYLQRLGQMFTLRQLLAAANVAPAPIDEPLPVPYVPPLPWEGGPGDGLLPPVLPPIDEPFLPLGSGGPAPPVLPWDLGPGVAIPIPEGPGLPYTLPPAPVSSVPWNPILNLPALPWELPTPFLPYGPPDVVNPPMGLPVATLPIAPMMPAERWTVTIDDNGGFTSTRLFPVRVVVEGKGRLVYSEAELSDALVNGGHIAGPNDNGNLTDLILRPEVEPPLEFPRPVEYAAPAAGFPWWLLMLGAGLAFSKRRG